MKTNIDNVLNDIQLHKFYENTFCALARYYNNVIDTIQITLYDNHSIQHFYYGEIPFYLCDI